MSTMQEQAQQAVVEGRSPTVARVFLDCVERAPDGEAYRTPSGNGWRSRTWRETATEVENLAAGLVALGVAPQERVAIASATRYEWIAADLAVMCAGAATTTVYPTTVPEDVAFIVADSQSRVVIAEDDAQVDKLRAHRADLPDVRAVVTVDGTPDGPGEDRWVLGFAELAELGAAHLREHPEAVRERIAAGEPQHLATLIYTSGTTGKPKGVRLPHSAWTYEGAAIAATGLLTAEDLQYLWLPMAHVFGKVLLMAQLQLGFPTAVDGRVDKIVENLAVVQPTVMGAAPRIFEKAYGRIVTTARGEGGAKARIFDRAVAVGLEVSRRTREGRRVPPLLAAQHRLFDRLVFAKVRDRFGGRIRFFISGSAALSGEVAEWFHAAGLLILEGYGLTESSAGSTVNRPDGFKIGTVGRPLPGTEVRRAEDGELLIRGPGVMEGYHGLPEETAAVLVDGGWLATGDIGEIDDEGFVRITDRKKDLFKTSGGKYVAPSSIEGAFKGVCPLASQMLVHGEGRNYVVALITLDVDAVTAWGERTGTPGGYDELVRSDTLRAEVDRAVQELNSRLNRWETIKKFTILPRDLTVDDGELTPSLKVRRRVIERTYRAELDALYRS